MEHLCSSYLSKLNTQETNIDLDVPESEKSCEECDMSKASKLPHTDKPQSISSDIAQVLYHRILTCESNQIESKKTFVDTLKILGVTLYRELNLDQHVSNVARK